MNLRLFFFIFIFSLKVFGADPFDGIRMEVLKGQREKAIALLREGINKGEIKGEDLSLAFYLLGTLLFQSGSFEESAKFFHESLKAGSKLSDSIHLNLGRIYKTLGKFEEAHWHLRQIRMAWGSKKNYLEARFELGLLGVIEKDWHQARLHFRYLARRLRGTEYYPQVLWHLALVENKLRRPWQACRWARKLYAKYPTHPLVKEWGIHLQTAKISGESLGCYATSADIKMRIKHLSWAGETDRARAEIESLKTPSGGDRGDYPADYIMADYLVDEGYVEEAFKLLKKYYDEKKNDLDYLWLVGKVAARAQKYQLSIAAYMRAYDLNPHSRLGREGLYRAAFVSYQAQDYDGAIRKFEKVTQKFRRSRLFWDAKWHLAWIRYLKGDFEGAYKSLAQYKSNRFKLRRYRLSKISDKVTYWMAMSLLKSGRPELARHFLSAITNGNGYYNILAQLRLEEASKSGDEIRRPASEQIPSDLELVGPEVGDEEKNIAEGSEEDEGEETENQDAASESEDDDEEIAEDPTDAEEDAKDMTVSMTFGNPDFMRKYQRAQDLIRVGLYESARWELYDIETRIRDPKKLRMLISQYQAIESFHRSSYVGYVVLGHERTKKGIEGAKDLWEASYPLAYQSLVKNVATEFNVPINFVWSIIRAESQFRPDAKSPTGAMGLMQVMPNTAKQVARLLKDTTFHVDQLLDPATNIRIGTRYLEKLIKKFDGQLALVAAAYNAGPHRVDSWLMSFGGLDTEEFIEHIPFFETREYVKKVLSNLYNYNLIYSSQKSQLTWLTAPVAVKNINFSTAREIWE